MKRTLSLTLTALTLAVSLSACGGSDEPARNVSATQAAPDRGAGPGARPGSGKVAAVDGSTAQVQGSDGQTAVSWTTKTTFTAEVKGSLEDVTQGACVLVRGESDDDAVTASAVTISPAVDGECQGPGGGRGARPTDMPTDRPKDLPSDAPSGAPGGRSGGMASGTVTAVSDTGFTVESTTPGADEKRSVTVSVTDDTAFATTAQADASAVKVGVCLQTEGESDSTGAVAATSIRVSPATDGECTSGFGRPSGQGAGR